MPPDAIDRRRMKRASVPPDLGATPSGTALFVEPVENAPGLCDPVPVRAGPAAGARKDGILLRRNTLTLLLCLAATFGTQSTSHAQESVFSVEIPEPDRGDLFAGQVVLEALVDPPHGATIDQVEFVVDGAPLSIDQEAPFQAVWTTIDPRRDHLIRVTAIASDGQRAYALHTIPILGAVERVSVTGRSPDFVLLGVTFLDANGRPVVDVQQEEVRVLEDGEPQMISVLAPDDRPLAAELLLDASQSTGPLWGTLGRSTQLFADTMRDGDRAGVMAFNSQIVELAPLGSSSQEIGQATAEFRDWGGTTRLYDAVAQGSLLGLGQEESHRRALVALTDAEDFGSTMEVSDAEDYLARSEVQIHALILFADQQVSSPQRAFSRGGFVKLAELTGGSAQSVGVIPMAEAFVRLGERLRAQYLLGYNSVSRKPPGKARKIEVQFLRPGNYRVLARRSHFGSQTLAQYLVEEMNRGPERRRRQAVRTAARMDDPVALQGVIGALAQGKTTSSGVAREARLGLLERGVEMVPQLGEAARSRNAKLEARAAGVLVDVFSRAMRAEDTDRVNEALRLLGNGDADAGRAALQEIDPEALTPSSRDRLEEVLETLSR